MTPPLTLLRLRPDMPALIRAAERRRFLPPGGDPGYALHAALAAVFGAAAPRPFALREAPRGAELLAYAGTTAEELLALAALPQMGDAEDLAQALLATPPEAKPMPGAWRSGQRLGFTLRARPIVRSRPEGRAGPHREHDVFAHARHQAVEPAALPSREALYLEWLARAFGRDGAASLEAARLASYRSIQVLRRPLRGAARGMALIEGPDATLEGSLRVGDPAAFAAMVARGVGRHAAFGFGMLLLAPPKHLTC